ncbi:MAG: ABC transporter permease [Prevotellaceae bacterium]|jgi:putative ABC transport system permease protein|nr:ABC transporter permease [Prevotellaceae bacterium]
MNVSDVIRLNIKNNRRCYRLIIAATLIMTGVVTGSLIIGESVRDTLVQRVRQRLGDTETVIFSRNSFFEEALAQAPAFEGKAKPALLVNGFVSDAGRFIPVMVWGVDDSGIPPGGAVINQMLARELSANRQAPTDIILRLSATGMAPSGSLFVTGSYTTSARLAFAGIMDKDKGGNMSLKNEQVIPCNLFVNRSELASILKIDGKINLILTPETLTEADIEKVWTPPLSGIRVNGNEITSDRIFLQSELVETVCRDNSPVNRLFSYMVNSLICGNDAIPYSFVTAADEYAGESLDGNDVILSDYSAKRLNAGIGDSITMTFFVSGDLKTLREDSVRLRVSGIVDIKDILADRTLSADFPGLSDVEKCTDWDSDLPVDMSRITKEDENYWTQYRSAPKAIAPYRVVAPKWSNAYGCATALRTPDVPDLSELRPEMTGIQLMHPKEAGLKAAQNGIDFASLFLSLGIFIVISAVMLMIVPLAEMIFQRRSELALLGALGFSKKRITSLLWRESTMAVTGASVAGVIAGICYTALIVMLLNTLWRGAVHSDGFTLHAGAPTLLTGLLAGTAIALVVLGLSITRNINRIDNPLKIRPDKPDNSARFGFWKIIRANLYANRKRVGLSFVTLASGVLIVFSVGLNRRSFADSSKLQSGTGGYTLWCETSVPVYHNLSTDEGRKKLSLNDLPSNAQVLQLLQYGADDASCLNLNKVTRPTVLGVDMRDLKNSRFQVKQSIYPAGTSAFDEICKATGDNVYPVMIDETVLLWGLQMKIGDTVRYETDRGEEISLLLAAALQNSVFQGNLLMDKSLFKEIWNEITGSEISLIRVNESETEAVKMLLETALSEYGVTAIPTVQRLKEFNSVTDTYLTIFLVLGGLGLLLGMASLIIVVRKDLISRAGQINLLRAIGFSDERISRLLKVETRIVPVSAVFAGVALSLLAVIEGVAGVSIGIWITALVFMLLLIAGVWVFIDKSVEIAIEKQVEV